MKPFVIWDLDGTLVDSGADIAAAANAARADPDLIREIADKCVLSVRR
jgi:phosphoglycolate phosphatase-like HAD superfamily hydrolase